MSLHRSLRCLLLFLVISPLQAQITSDRPDQMWLQDGVICRSWTRDGDLGYAGLNGSTRISLAPGGAVWALNVSFRRLHRGATGLVVLPVLPTDLAVDSRDHAFVGLSDRTLREYDSTLRLVSTFLLYGLPRSLSADRSGRVWIGVQNTPSGLLSWIDRGGTFVNTVGLPPGNGQVIDLLAAGDASGDRVFVVTDGDQNVLEVDRSGSIVRRIPIPTSALLGQLALAPDRSLWVASGSGAWRIDLGTARVQREFTGPVAMVAFDTHGDLWIASGQQTFRYDVGSGRKDAALGIPGQLGDDPCGVRLALIVDPGSDWDADGADNASEVAQHTNPWDPLSSPRLWFDTTRSVVSSGQSVDFVSRGDFGWAVLLFSSRSDQVWGGSLGTTISGIDGKLWLSQPILASVTMPVPGSPRFTVPNSLPSSVVLYAQPLLLPLRGGTPRFGEVAKVTVSDPPVQRISETFASDSMLDRPRSSGSWINGVARAGAFGGTGRLGSFDPMIGRLVAPNSYEFDTDAQVFPASVTLFGRVETVTDGVFEFTDFVVPSGEKVRFVGSKPAVIRVRGDVRIDGELSVDGDDLTLDGFTGAYPGPGVVYPGQAGGRGGAGGGAGGKGADSCLGLGTGNGSFSGVDGSTLIAPATSGYANGVFATNGRGGPLWPTTGLNSSVTFGFFAALSSQTAAGGSGGGFLVPGGNGAVLLTTPPGLSEASPMVVGGAAIGFVGAPPDVTSLDHFLIGGSGGGGGGSHPFLRTFLELVSLQRSWWAGFGGAGGGGAMALRCGRDLTIGPQGRASGRGGSALDYGAGFTMWPSPGGSGSGGSVLLQVAGAIQQLGTIDISGGTGGALHGVRINAAFDVRGGDGAHGFVRLEQPSLPPVSALGVVAGPPSLGADNVGLLRDTDNWAGQVSTWYSTNATTVPEWLSYRLDVQISGANQHFTDAANGYRPAMGVGVPVQLYLQGGRFDANTNQFVNLGPWRSFTADLAQDRATALRFMLLFDRSSAIDAAVDLLEIDFR